MTGRDSLKPLQARREHEKEQQAVKLAQASLKAAQAADEHRRATLAREAQQAGMAVQQATETERLGAGVASAADLVHHAAFSTRARSLLKTLTENEQRQSSELEQALTEHREQQARMTGAVAQADAVTEHRSRLLAEQRRSKEEREDELADEQWVARHSLTGQR
ncbi:MAG TPA: hypothetical protein VL137_09895 [Polyangiaceae bacterium]|nr:hypothetical protein [Polyangiaceae bacterium]